MTFGPWDVDPHSPVSDDPLNRGLASWWLGLPPLVGGGRLWDVKGGVHAELGSSTARPSWAVGPGGFGALSFDGGDQATAAAVVTAAPLTIACWFRSSNTTASQYLVSINDGADHQWALNLGGNAGGDPVRAVIQDGPGTTIVAATTTGYSANVWAHGVAVFASSTSRAAYINGGSKGTGSVSRTPTGVTQTRFGRVPTGLYLTGQMADVRVWRRALSDAEVLAVYRDSLAGYRRTLNRWRRRGLLVSLPYGVVTSYTLTAEAVSPALAANAAALNAARKILAAATRPAAAPGDAALVAARKIPADALAPALTLGDATLAAARVIPAGGVSPAITPADATLAKGWLDLAADAVSPALTISAAALTAGRVVFADATRPALNLPDAATAAARVLPADAVSPALTPGGVTFTLGSPGAFTLTAESVGPAVAVSAAALAAARELLADAAAPAAALADATLAKGWLALTAGAAGPALTISAAGLAAARTLPAGPLSPLPAVSAATLARDPTLPAGVVSPALGLADAGLASARTLPADALAPSVVIAAAALDYSAAAGGVALIGAGLCGGGVLVSFRGGLIG